MCDSKHFLYFSDIFFITVLIQWSLGAVIWFKHSFTAVFGIRILHIGNQILMICIITAKELFRQGIYITWHFPKWSKKPSQHMQQSMHLITNAPKMLRPAEWPKLCRKSFQIYFLGWSAIYFLLLHVILFFTVEPQCVNPASSNGLKSHNLKIFVSLNSDKSFN